jgi:hypothetical protein
VISALSKNPGTVRRMARRRPYRSARIPYGMEQIAPVGMSASRFSLQSENIEHNNPSSKSEYPLTVATSV